MAQSMAEGEKMQVRNCCVSSESLVLPDHKSTEPAGSIPQPKAAAAGAHGEFSSLHAELGPV